VSEETLPSGRQSPDEVLSDQEQPTHALPGATEQACANHSNRLTMVTCSACGKPLCPDCMVYSAVGIKCKECATPPRSALVTLKASKFLLAIAAGLWTATALGFAYYYILGSIRFFFVFIFVSAGIGYLVGEVVSRTSGRYRGLKTAITAAGATVWAFVLPPITAAFISYGVHWNTAVFALSARGIINWVVMLFAAFLAWNRNR
jgi:MFS family permease